MDPAALPFPEKETKSVETDSLTGYAQPLRAIGQALETLNVGDFTVEPGGGEGYRITGASVELSYLRSDVERLDREGRSQRATVHGTADNSRLSQTLRVIGSYLTQKYCRLIRVSRKGESFEVHYESSLGSRYSEKFSAADLYDLWVRFYLQRSVRTV